MYAFILAFARMEVRYTKTSSQDSRYYDGGMGNHRWQCTVFVVCICSHALEEKQAKCHLVTYVYTGYIYGPTCMYLL